MFKIFKKNPCNNVIKRYGETIGQQPIEEKEMPPFIENFCIPENISEMEFSEELLIDALKINSYIFHLIKFYGKDYDCQFLNEVSIRETRFLNFNILGHIRTIMVV